MITLSLHDTKAPQADSEALHAIRKTASIYDYLNMSVDTPSLTPSPTLALDDGMSTHLLRTYVVLISLDQIRSIHDKKTFSSVLPAEVKDATSLSAVNFVWYMNKIGWMQGGTFVTSLSAMGYHLNEVNGVMVMQKWADRVAPILSLIIFEL